MIGQILFPQGDVLVPLSSFVAVILCIPLVWLMVPLCLSQQFRFASNWPSLSKLKKYHPELFWNAALAYAKSNWELFTYPFVADRRVKSAYAEMNGKPIRLRSSEGWITLVSSHELVNDIKNATNDQLSLNAVVKELLKPGYTMNGFNWHDQKGTEGVGYVKTLRLLTQHLPQLTPGVCVILDRTFAEEIGNSGSINVFTLCKRVITKINAYAFFGLDYVGNNEFVDAAYYYNEDVLYGSELLRLTPRLLVPLIGWFMTMSLKRQKTFFHGLVAIIEDRMNNPKPLKKHNDVIQWTIDTSPKSKPWSPGRIAFEIMAVWFGSVQGLAVTLTFAIYSLCEHPEYIEPLRAEIQSSAGAEFFTTGNGLPLMDSFLKECSRWTPIESLTARRCALKDFTFSDGSRVAKGEWVGIPAGPMLRDPSKYPQPDVFDGFRFAECRNEGGKGSKQPEGPSKFTDVSDNWYVWGTGKLTCPGRFFVSYAMKHTLVHLLENYDVEMVQKNRRNKIHWRTATLPGLGVKAKFTKRA